MPPTKWKAWLGPRLTNRRALQPQRARIISPTPSSLMGSGHVLCLFSQLTAWACLWLAALSLAHSWQQRSDSGPSLLLDPVLAGTTALTSLLLLSSWYRPRLRPIWLGLSVALLALVCLAGFVAGWPWGPGRAVASLLTTGLMLSATAAWWLPRSLQLATGIPLRRLGLLTGLLGTLIAALGATALAESYRLEAVRQARHFNHEVLHQTHNQTQVALAWLRRLSERWAALPAPPSLAFMRQELTSSLRDHHAFRELAVIEEQTPILVVEAPHHDYHPPTLSLQHLNDLQPLEQAIRTAQPIRALSATPDPHGLLLEYFYLPIIRTDVPETVLAGTVSLDRILDDAALRLPSSYVFRIRNKDLTVYQSASQWPTQATHSGTVPLALDNSKDWRLDFSYLAPRPTPLARVFPELIFLGGLIFTILLIIAEELARLARARAQQLHYTTNHDALTRLPNRLYLEALLAQPLDQANKPTEITIIMVDLDKLREINDAHGYAAGDCVLIEAGKRLQAVVAEMGVVARFGADEFVAAIYDRPGKQVESLASRMLRELGRPYLVEGGRARLTGTAGISSVSAAGGYAAAQECLHEADLAMRQAKREGLHQWRRYTPALGLQLSRRLEATERLSKALEDEVFELCYQPVVSARDGRIIELEALLRWPTEDGTILPGSYLGLAEESGQIVAITQWVIRQASQHAALLQNQGIKHLPITINISPLYFRQREFIPHLKSAMRSAQLSRGSLAVEITEAALLAEPERASQVVANLHALDISTAIDDFGTGHFNLKTLSQLPIDRIKLDVSLVAGLGQRSIDTTLITTIIPLAHQLGLEVVAEGVETLAQYEFLQQLGCDHYQGYLLSAPLPFETLLRRLELGWTQLELPAHPFASCTSPVASCTPPVASCTPPSSPSSHTT